MMQRILRRITAAGLLLTRGERAIAGKRPPIRALTPEEIAEARSFFPRPKFFVYGAARSGTTLLMRLIDAHPDILCTRQAHFFSREPFLHSLVDRPEVAEWLSRSSMRWNRGQDLSPVVLRAAADFILEREAARSGAAVVGDKSPNSLTNGSAVDLTHRIYPDARIIFLVRDGRDAALSHRFQAFIDATEHLTRADWQIRAEFDRNPDSFRSPEKSLFTEKGIRDYAAGWVDNVESTSARGKALYGDRYHELRYEDLLADPVREMEKIWAFLGAELVFPGSEDAVEGVVNFNRDASWQETRAGKFADKIPKGQPGSWREYFSSRDTALFFDLAGQTLRKWGYE